MMGPIERLLPLQLTLAETSPAHRRRAERIVSLAIVAGVLGSGGILLKLLSPGPMGVGDQSRQSFPQAATPTELDRRLTHLERRVVLLEARMNRAEGVDQEAGLR